MSAARVLMLVLLIGGSAQADDFRRRADPVPLPQAPSSLPPPPWAAYGAGPYGWGAVGIIVADPWLPSRSRRLDGDLRDRYAPPPYRDDADRRDRGAPAVRW